jgi:pimeloyl-ACP methyl ester carboxylesterase
MNKQANVPGIKGRIHRTTSKDGVRIAASVVGQGPPVLLLPAGPGDSELSWRHVVPFLSEKCTCYLLETRGRGMSDDDPDHSPDRLVEDVLAFAGSIGEPVGIVGWGSALWARVATRNPDSVFATAVYEPGAGEVMTPETGNRMGQIFSGVGEHVAAGRVSDAANTFIENCDVIYSQEDIDSGAPADFWSSAAERLPLFLQESKQASGSGKPGATSPETLGKIKMPVLILQGDRTSQWFSDSVKHVAKHTGNTTVHKIHGAAHFGPITHAQEVANVMAQFFDGRHS